MYTTQQMSNVIRAIADQHDLDLLQMAAHLRLENPPYMPLSIEVISLHPHLVAVGHTFVQNGDLMYDPEIVYWVPETTGLLGEWWPVEMTMHPLGIYRRFMEFEGDKPVRWDKSQVKMNASFSNTWARNLKSQGFIEA